MTTMRQPIIAEQENRINLTFAHGGLVTIDTFGGAGTPGETGRLEIRPADGTLSVHIDRRDGDGAITGVTLFLNPA